VGQYWELCWQRNHAPAGLANQPGSALSHSSAQAGSTQNVILLDAQSLYPGNSDVLASFVSIPSTSVKSGASMAVSSLKMHKYVWGGIAIFIAFAASFPLAILRVSQTSKFAGQPFNSLTCEGAQPGQRTVTKFATCIQGASAVNPTN
jgi:hypothetical protein